MKDEEYNIKIEEALKVFREAKSIMIFSGAGMSTESGIKDFRSSKGLYSNTFGGFDPEEILSSTFFNNNPEVFWDYVRENFDFRDVKPSSSYESINELGKLFEIKGIVTQNIDSLHKLANNPNVLEVHGNIRKCYCDVCSKEYDYNKLIDKTTPIKCDVKGCRGYVRPDIVLYEEPVFKLPEVYRLIKPSDMLLVLGSSLTVYPVAQIPALFLGENKKVVIINNDRTPYSNSKGVVEINAPIGQTLSDIINRLNL